MIDFFPKVEDSLERTLGGALASVLSVAFVLWPARTSWPSA